MAQNLAHRLQIDVVVDHLAGRAVAQVVEVDSRPRTHLYFRYVVDLPTYTLESSSGELGCLLSDGHDLRGDRANAKAQGAFEF